jgi:hypothetical protein
MAMAAIWMMAVSVDDMGNWVVSWMWMIMMSMIMLTWQSSEVVLWLIWDICGWYTPRFVVCMYIHTYSIFRTDLSCSWEHLSFFITNDYHLIPTLPICFFNHTCP